MRTRAHNAEWCACRPAVGVEHLVGHRDAVWRDEGRRRESCPDVADAGPYEVPDSEVPFSAQRRHDGGDELMVSYSGTQMMEESDCPGLLDDIESFIRSNFGGAVTRPLVVTLTTTILT